MAPSLLDAEWPQEGAFMSINGSQPTVGAPSTRASRSIRTLRAAGG
jgi:hypothetical protein